MGRYLLRRLASAVVTLWLLATIVFLIVNVLPGNVGRRVLGPFALEEDVVRFNHQLGTDRALLSQYLTSIRRLFTLDFGNSYQTGAPVTDDHLPGVAPLREAGTAGVRHHDPDLHRGRHLRCSPSGQDGRPGGRQHQSWPRRRSPSS